MVQSSLSKSEFDCTVINHFVKLQSYCIGTESASIIVHFYKNQLLLAPPTCIASFGHHTS